MTGPHPDDLMKNFSDHLSTLWSSDPITPAIRRKMGEDLSSAYNYLMDFHRKPSLQRVLRSQAAQTDKQRDELEKERSLLKEHRKFVESNIEKADQYIRTIQLAGYAAFFAIWSFSNAYIDPLQAKIALLLMLLSAVVFVGWEVWKATLIGLSLKRHASITSDAETFVRNRLESIISKNMTLISQSRQRLYVWFFCVITASLSIIIIVFSLLESLIS